MATDMSSPPHGQGSPHFPDSKQGWQGYFYHHDRRGFYPGEGTDMAPNARAPTAPPAGVVEAPPSVTSPGQESSRCGRRRGCWGLWGRSAPGESPQTCPPAPDQQASATQPPERPHPAGARHWGRPSPDSRQEYSAADAPPFHPGFYGDHSGYPGFHGDHSGYPGFHGDHSGFPGSGPQGAGFHGDHGRWGAGPPFPPFYGHRHPAFYGSGRFQSGPESRYIFREFDFQ